MNRDSKKDITIDMPVIFYKNDASTRKFFFSFSRSLDLIGIYGNFQNK
jgi:hypothetical protein